MTFERRDDFYQTGADINSLKWFAPNGQSGKFEVSSNYFAVATLRAQGFIASLRHLRIWQSPLAYQRNRGLCIGIQIPPWYNTSQFKRRNQRHISIQLWNWACMSITSRFYKTQNLQDFRCFWGLKRQTFDREKKDFFNQIYSISCFFNCYFNAMVYQRVATP